MAPLSSKWGSKQRIWVEKSGFRHCARLCTWSDLRNLLDRRFRPVSGEQRATSRDEKLTIMPFTHNIRRPQGVGDDLRRSTRAGRPAVEECKEYGGLPQPLQAG